MINPHNDGVTHINVYSQGQTSLGRFLSNFAYSPITTEDGNFDSVEGYWYWLSSKDDKLRKLSGYEAKKYGRSIEAKDWLDDEEFKRKIKEAIKIKLESNPKFLAELVETKLPLKHYYVYDDTIIQIKDGKWILEYLETFKRSKKK